MTALRCWIAASTRSRPVAETAAASWLRHSAASASRQVISARAPVVGAMPRQQPSGVATSPRRSTTERYPHRASTSTPRRYRADRVARPGRTSMARLAAATINATGELPRQPLPPAGERSVQVPELGQQRAALGQAPDQMATAGQVAGNRPPWTPRRVTRQARSSSAATAKAAAIDWPDRSAESRSPAGASIERMRAGPAR